MIRILEWCLRLEVLLAVFLALSSPRGMQSGDFYDPWADEVHCSDWSVPATPTDAVHGCWHELGHMADALCAPQTWMSWQWCSADPEWRSWADNAGLDASRTGNQSIAALFPGIGGNPYWYMADGNAWGGYRELYATLWAWNYAEAHR
jgi:hypothetical protein